MREPKLIEVIKRHQRDELEANMSWTGELKKHFDRGVLIRLVLHLLRVNYRLRNNIDEREPVRDSHDLFKPLFGIE